MRSLLIFASLGFVACSNNNLGGGDMSVDQGTPDLTGSGSDGGSNGSCDVTTQTCGAGMKCVPAISGMMVVGTCVADGTKTEGQACTQDMSSQTVFNDDCKAGLLCDGNGANGTTLCKKICTADSQCTAANNACGGFVNNWGLCLQKCTLFGTDCAGGNSCASAFFDVAATMANPTGFFVCKPDGAGKPYDSCMADTDCGANLGCDQNQGWCAPVCDSGHVCTQPPIPDGGSAGDGGFVMVSCMPFPNLTGGQGICQ
jgi:hypothetical protein